MNGRLPPSRIRLAGRLANGFALDLVKLGGWGRDVIDGLLLMAISQANIAPITRSPELQLAYATLDAPPPDELRRPVSVNAVATSLRIPFETARRRIAALAELGVLETSRKGVVLPQAPLNSPFYRAFAEANCELVRRYYERLDRLGFLTGLNRPDTSFTPGNPPLRLIMRLSSDYALRLAEPVSAYIGDLVTGMILMDVIQANTEHLPDDEGGGDDLSPQSYLADDERRPVRPATLSERLGVPPETVRRHLNRLVSDGRCVVGEDGYVVPARVLADGGFVEFILDNQTHMHRLFTGLAEFGVLSFWDAPRAGLRGAA